MFTTAIFNQYFKIDFFLEFTASSVPSADSRQMWFTEHGDYLKIYRVIYTIASNDLLQTLKHALALSSVKSNFQAYPFPRARLSSVDSTHVATLGEGRNSLCLERKPSLQHRLSTPEVLRLIERPKTVTSIAKVKPTSTSAVNYPKIQSKNPLGRPIYLSSKIFVAQRKTQSISELRDQIQEWFNALEVGKS